MAISATLALEFALGTDIDVYGHCEAPFGLQSTGDVCFYINDGFTKTIRNISAVNQGGFILRRGDQRYDSLD